MPAKSQAEAKVERVTWFALVAVFAVITLIPEDSAGLPHWVTPLAGGAILLISGIYQYARGWRVSPSTWIAGSLLLVAAYYSNQINPNIDMLPISLLIFAAVIGIGVITGET